MLFEWNENFPRKDGTKVGLYAETKMYSFYKTRGLDISEAFYNVLKKYDLETV